LGALPPAKILAGNDAANVLNGGAGDDEIRASGADDRLIGGAGNDFLSGSGYDVTTFVFGANAGHDLVAGFTPKATLPSYLAHEVIEIDPSVLPNFAALMAAATEDEYGHTTISLSDTSSIVLWSISKASLSADDFLFVSPGWEGNDPLYSTSGNDTAILRGGRRRRDRQPCDVRSPEHDRRRNRYAGRHREPHRLRLRRHAFRRRLE
jgi:RTX calcium-binding nonapeptide repeat (4 copies)